jgi:hypothetical protein
VLCWRLLWIGLLSSRPNVLLPFYTSISGLSTGITRGGIAAEGAWPEGRPLYRGRLVASLFMGKSLRPLHKAEPMRLFRGELPRRSPCGLAFTEINSANEIHMPTFHAYAANTARGPLQPF